MAAEEGSALLNLLRIHDPEHVELRGGDGGVLVCPGLQGRIFCRLDDELIHRLDGAALTSPSATDYDNLGGNSLWPAPEGGPFAFNYPPPGDRWTVQDGIAKAVPSVTEQDERRVVVEKRIELVNRKGVRIDVLYRRAVLAHAASPAQGYELIGFSYRTEDTCGPRGVYSPEDVLIAPWSLEQLPGADGVTAFCKVHAPESAINFDFYAYPEGRIHCGEGFFTFALGGADRHQIGVKAACAPEFIGALDPHRSMLMLRRAEPQAGTYFNIADNDQPAGPFSAADLYSVFNGGALGFFELKTIGAMKTQDGRVGAGTLVSETVLLKGSVKELLRYLAEKKGLHLEGKAL